MEEAGESRLGRDGDRPGERRGRGRLGGVLSSSGILQSAAGELEPVPTNRSADSASFSRATSSFDTLNSGRPSRRAYPRICDSRWRIWRAGLSHVIHAPACSPRELTRSHKVIPFLTRPRVLSVSHLLHFCSSLLYPSLMAHASPMNRCPRRTFGEPRERVRAP